MYLGQSLEESKDITGAVAAYRQYLAHARRDEEHRETVEAAISSLTGSKPASGG
jgi:hypothetical protein